MIYLSTFARNQMLHTSTLRDYMQRRCFKMGLYSGSIPASADAAVTGTLICTVTGGGETAKAKKMVRYTPVTSGTTGTFSITLNGVVYTFTDDASPTVAEVCTGLYRLINTAQGATSKYFTTATDGAITAGGRINIPGIYQKFTLTDNTTSLDIEAATAGEDFDYSATATGAGNSISTAVITEDAYGLKFEAVADIASGVIEKLASQTWSGENAADGVVSHYRIFEDGDDQTVAQGTTYFRIQGQVSTAGADLNFRSTTFYSGDTTTISDDFNLTFPASRT